MTIYRAKPSRLRSMCADVGAPLDERVSVEVHERMPRWVETGLLDRHGNPLSRYEPGVGPIGFLSHRQRGHDQ